MALRFALALLMSFLLCSQALPGSKDKDMSPFFEFDHFRLILVWPGSICDSKVVGVCCVPITGKPAVDFLVQDLQTWRQLFWLIWQVESCSKKQFDIKAIDGKVYNQMTKRWTTLDCPSTSPVQMWNTTWRVSGSCSNKNENTFFGTGLNIATQANMLGALAKYGIVPSDKKQYPVENVWNALEETIGKKVVVTCNINQEGKIQIYNVHVCANKNGNALIDCPHSDNSCKGPAVMLPTFTTTRLFDTSIHAVDLKMVV